MKKNLLALFLAMMLVLSVAASAETVRLMTFWGEDTKHAGMDAVSALVMAEHPEWKFEATHMNYDNFFAKIKAELAAGDPPTIITAKVREVVEMIDAGKILPLDEFEWMKNYSEERLTETLYEGKVYQCPLDINIMGMFYRKELFREVLGSDEPPTTRSEFKALCEKFKEAGYTPIAFGGTEADPCTYTVKGWLDGYMAQNDPDINAKIITGETTFAESETYNTVFKMIYEDLIPYIDPSDMGIPRERAYDLFLAQERPMTMHGTFATGVFRSAVPDGEFGLFPICWSEDPAENKVEVNNDDDLMIVADGNVEAGIAWMEKLNSVEGLSAWAQTSGAIPGNDLAKEAKLDPANEYCFNKYVNGEYYRQGDFNALPGAISTEFQQLCQKFFADGVSAYAEGKTADEYVPAFLQEVDERCSEYYEQYADTYANLNT